LCVMLVVLFVTFVIAIPIAMLVIVDKERKRADKMESVEESSNDQLLATALTKSV
jgi:Flp pilus assembly protein TadB